ncbi:MAG: hypothetical protein IKT73_07250 [Anaerotignum sp.]|nr:hypothetical protein [Anaerotignum sp.]
MSYCPNCGKQILDENLGCPVCNVRNNIDPSKDVIDGQAEEIKVETVEEFTVEDSDGKTHHFESSTETGEAEYKKQSKVAEDAKIHPLLKVAVIALVVMVGGFGAIAGCVAGVVLSKSPSQDYRDFGSLLMKVSILMLVLSFVCCGISTGMGFVGSIFNMGAGGSTPTISY